MSSIVERRQFLARCGRQGTWTLRSWWAEHDEMVLGIAASIMLIAALVWLGYEFWRLLWKSGGWAAIDLRILHGLVHGWFAGRPVYNELGAMHPPATYLILWPFLGWMSETPARWLWGVTTVAVLGWLVCLVIRESKADTVLERAFIALMPLSMYATGATIGNGQLIIHLLPALVVALTVLYSGRAGWRTELFGAILFLLTLVKPSISAPFFWIVLFSSRGLRPAVLVVLGYAGLTLFAASFQQSSLWELLRDWLATPGLGQEGRANLQAWLINLDLKEWAIPASMFVLAAHGFWTYWHRQISPWLLIGVTAIVARIWTYHRWYDDLLMLLPMLALFRIAKAGPADGSDILAGILFALTVLTLLAPGGLYLFPSPWNAIYETGQIVVWMIGLIFLLNQAWQEKTSAPR